MARHMTNKKIDKLGQLLKSYNRLKSIIKHDQVLLNSTDEIKYRLYNNQEIIRRIDLAMEVLSTESKNIIIDYYINNIGWIVISKKIGTSERNCQRIRDDAILKLYECLYGERLDMKTGHAQMTINTCFV